jgi:hemerythrin-like domain-containing protein
VKTNVTQVMMEEHQLILRMIALVEQKVAALEQGHFHNWQFFLDGVDFIRNYADRFHHAKEEAVLFAALVNNGMPAKQSPIEAMHLEHEQGRAHVRALEAAACQALAGNPWQIPVIVEEARGYTTLLRSHITKEDTILYPLAERVLPQEVRAAMLAAYAQAETATPGLAAKYRELVTRYERQAAA